MNWFNRRFEYKRQGTRIQVNRIISASRCESKKKSIPCYARYTLL